tara:strand:+ start:1901 stop:2197 length:297 start_codon:yes stop_codon:yes gene_type:complete
MSIYIITPNTDDVVNKNDKNTQYTLKGVTNDVPTPAEFSALDAFADHFETEEGQIGDYARDHAMKTARSEREEAWLNADDGLKALLDENGQLPPDAFI